MTTKAKYKIAKLFNKLFLIPLFLLPIWLLFEIIDYQGIMNISWVVNALGKVIPIIFGLYFTTYGFWGLTSGGYIIFGYNLYGFNSYELVSANGPKDLSHVIVTSLFFIIVGSGFFLYALVGFNAV